MKLKGDPAKVCERSGKLTYPTRLKAIRALDRLRAKQASGDPVRHEVAAYVCPACGRWHLTSRGQSEDQLRSGKAVV